MVCHCKGGRTLCEKLWKSSTTQEQAKTLLEAIKGTIIENIVNLTIIYGLRRSEAVGLKWSAVSLENDTFTIESTVVRFSEIVEKSTTKNQASHRTYPITPEIKQMFLSIQEQQRRMKELFGNAYNDSGYVFTWEDGRILNPDYVTRKFSQILKANGLPHIRFHDGCIKIGLNQKQPHSKGHTDLVLF